MDDRLDVKVIGKGTGAVITDLIEKGESDLLNELEETVPKGLVPLLKIPGLGGKRIAKLRETIGIDSIESLHEACLEGAVRKVPGFGKKTEENILAAIEAFGTRQGKFPHWKMEKVVHLVETRLEEIPEITRFSVTGSYRRTEEESSDVDFIILTDTTSEVRYKLLAS